MKLTAVALILALALHLLATPLAARAQQAGSVDQDDDRPPRWVAQGGRPSIQREPTGRAPTATGVRHARYARFFDAVVVIFSGDSRQARLGSGFFIDNKGTLLTNQHVVGAASKVLVMMRSGRLVSGRVIAARTDIDIAVVSIAEATPAWLALAAVADHAEVGADVLAIGAPEELSWSATKGIISSVRDLDGGLRPVQTDAAINQGSSGGPLILLDCGTVIGVVTLASRKWIAEGLNFAVAIDTIRRVFPQYLPNEVGRCEGASEATGRTSDGERISPRRSVQPPLRSKTPTDVTDAPSENRPAPGLRPATGTMLVRAGAIRGQGEMTVWNQLRDDAVVTLRGLGGRPDPYLVVYVRAGDSVILVDIPEGDFGLEYAVGRGWDGDRFTHAVATLRLQNPLTFESMPIVVRDAQGSRLARVPRDGWSVILRQGTTEPAGRGPTKPAAPSNR